MVSFRLQGLQAGDAVLEPPLFIQNEKGEYTVGPPCSLQDR